MWLFITFLCLSLSLFMHIWLKGWGGGGGEVICISDYLCFFCFTETTVVSYMLYLIFILLSFIYIYTSNLTCNILWCSSPFKWMQPYVQVMHCSMVQYASPGLSFKRAQRASQGACGWWKQRVAVQYDGWVEGGQIVLHQLPEFLLGTLAFIPAH